MASIDMQLKAKRAGKPLKRPTAKVRKSVMSGTGIIIEVLGPDGTRVMIDVDTHRNHKGLSVSVRAKFDDSPANPDVSVFTLSHEGSCRVFADSSLDARCDCGNESVPDGFSWKRTSKAAP